jgi:hypothetical protein
VVAVRREELADRIAMCAVDLGDLETGVQTYLEVSPSGEGLHIWGRA